MRFLITSDSHFGDDNIIGHERGGKFNSIAAHDEKLYSLWDKWMGKCDKSGSVFVFLGDLYGRGENRINAALERVSAICSAHTCEKWFLLGNHDREIANDSRLAASFDRIYEYPFFVSNRIVLSHFPQAVYGSQINVHGHTHGMKLKDPNHLCASVHVNNYSPIESCHIDSALSRVDRWCVKFLYEPWAKDYLLTQNHSIAIADYDGVIDLSASRYAHMIAKNDHGVNKTEK